MSSANNDTTRASTVVDTDYTTDYDPDLRNPERGMYFNRPQGPGDFHTIVPEWLWLGEVCGQDPSSKLNEYAGKLAEHRKNGVKVLFRPRYDDPGTRGGPYDNCTMNGGAPVLHADSMSRQIDHIDAVAAMLGQYRDVIAYIQAGYLGSWGEWNTAGKTAAGGSLSTANAPFLYNYDDRIAIIEHVVSAYDAANILQHVELRRPVFAKEVVDRNASANVGLHNDCFMTTNSDSGTYSDFTGSPANFGSSSAAKAWAQSFTVDKSFGGETCPVEDPDSEFFQNERWRSCDKMTTEPETLHLNYLNGDYAEDAVQTWMDGGCYDYIRRNLGYRFKVTRVEYTPTVAASESFSVRIDILSSGWARLHKPRKAKLVLRSGSVALPPYDAQSGGETELWAPGTTTQISFTGAPPPAGTYEVRLAIPDPDAPERISYAVRLASLRNNMKVFD